MIKQINKFQKDQVFFLGLLLTFYSLQLNNKGTFVNDSSFLLILALQLSIAFFQSPKQTFYMFLSQIMFISNISQGIIKILLNISFNMEIQQQNSLKLK
ncbi:hypothetical protein pb186bvf_016749 [Paramecium bursaria]